MDKNSFSEHLRSLRGQRTKTEFARFLGLSAPVYQRYEDGRIPRSNCLSVIASKCGVTIEWLLGESSSPPPTDPLRASAPPRENASPPSAGAQLCRFPSDCDLVKELAEQRSTMNQMKAQLDTLTQLLGASLRSSVEAPEREKRKAG